MPAVGSQNFQYGYPIPGPQSPTGQRVMDHVYFCSNDEWKRVRETEQFDYIVVGTGPCGYAFVEKVLTKNQWSRILMLERGEYFLPDHFQNLPFSFAGTFSGLSETFPWTLSRETVTGEFVKYQHGIIPFFGGMSTVWSAWCPRPTEEELLGWPKEVIGAAKKHYADAERLLNVVAIDPGDVPDSLIRLPDTSFMRSIYGTLHCYIVKTVKENLFKVPALTRSMEAPLAVGVSQLRGIDFQKFATPGPLLELRNKQVEAEKQAQGKQLKIATDCIVEQICHQDKKATALKTSRGVLNLGDAKLILAMGTIPPATLIVNSFGKKIPEVGQHLAAHFITTIVGRISVEDLFGSQKLKDIELGAVYVAGINGDYGKQFHIQLSVIHDKNPETNAKVAFQYAPDVVTTASRKQLETSKGCIVFVLACLGEMDVDNVNNSITPNNADSDKTSNILLNLTTNSTDEALWDVMDESSFSLLETIISPNDGKHKVEYWHGTPDLGDWFNERPLKSQIRVPGTVHESSTLIIGDKGKSNTSVGLDYRLHGVDNVYVTGGGLWPRSGSWNPTLTMVALAQHLADELEKEGKKVKTV